MAKQEPTIATHDKKGKLTGSLARGGKNAPVPSTIREDLRESLAKLGGPQGGEAGYKLVLARFEKARAKVDQEISTQTRGHDLSKNINMFRKVEDEAMRGAMEASNAAQAFTLPPAGDKEVLRSSVFEIAKNEANDKADEYALKYLAAVEARKAFEAQMEPKVEVTEGKGFKEHECTMRNGRCTRLEYHL